MWSLLGFFGGGWLGDFAVLDGYPLVAVVHTDHGSGFGDDGEVALFADAVGVALRVDGLVTDFWGVDDDGHCLRLSFRCVGFALGWA